jgi:acetyltransferase-like isoleucine patch superfamily enzyme
MILTPLLEVLILALGGFCSWLLSRWVTLDSFGWFSSFCIFQALWTVLALYLIRTIFPPKEGVFPLGTGRGPAYIWNLTGFLSCVNLYLFCVHQLVPPPMRAIFYRALGTRMGSGLQLINGSFSDPNLVTLGDQVMIGADAAVWCHIITASATGDNLVLAKVQIGSNALIGAKSVLFPGVSVGEGSMVIAASVVPMNTKIPAYEVWGGNPAVKIRDLPKPNGERLS